MKNLNELTIKEALEGLKAKEFTSVELTEACLKQIDLFDKELQVFIRVTRDVALQGANDADALIAEKGADAFKEKPLLGIPYVIKDNFCTEGIETTAGSNILRGYVPPYESTVTKRLMDAGAVLLGKTNQDAFAHGSSTETSDFFTTKNPWDVTRVPGGSSGGSSVAVMTDMCIFAIGSETGGSIRGPAAWTGMTGFKPSYGRTSRYGLIAMASSTDSPGPMTKTAEDAAYVLQVIAGKDPMDATTSPKEVADYVGAVAGVSGDTPLKSVKIGKPKSYFEMKLEEGVRERVLESLKVLEDLGAEIVEIDLLDPKYSIAVYTILQRSEVSSNLARLDGIRFGQTRDAFGFEAKKRMLLGAYTLSSGYYDEYYSKAQKVRTLIVDDFAKAFEKVDLIVGPSMPCIATKIGASDDNAMFGEMMDELTEPSTIAGLCGCSVPCGFSQGLPVGLQLIAPMFEEARLLQAVHAYQQKTDYHTKRPEIIERTSKK
jgi:aspartyl-tRNA(Asn)/glutamyl-tRNA(Gln) amidotransferase subunit A